MIWNEKRRAIRQLTIAILLFIHIVGCGPRARDASHRSRAVAALFEEFETVFYSNRDLSSDAGVFGHLSKEDAEELRTPFAYFLDAFYWLGDGVPGEILRNSAAITMGAKEFRVPVGLGPVHSQRCYIVVLGNWSTLDLRKYFNYNPTAMASGAPVWNWGANLGEFGEGDPRPSSLYAAVVANAYLLVSNNLQELQSIAARLTSATDDSSKTLDRISEWMVISQKDYWGYRQFHHTGLNPGDTSEIKDVTPSAEALLFFLNSNKRSCVLRLLASDDSTTREVNSWAVFAPLRPAGEGIWEAAIPLANDKQNFDQMFYVFGLLGFPVYL